MAPVDGLAFIGRNPLDAHSVFSATGDSGNGMTHGTIAGTLYDPTRKTLRAGIDGHGCHGICCWRFAAGLGATRLVRIAVADPAVWTFATGTQPQIKELTSRFSVHVQPEAGTISHGLATALISADGRIVKVRRGNGWKPEEVIAEVAK